MKRIILIVSGIICFLNVYTQEKEIYSFRKNEIGIQMGATTGFGLSYRHWFGKTGFQLSGIPIKTDNTEVYSVALTALYTFYDARYIRVFGYLGNHYLYDREIGHDQPWKGFDPTLNNSDDNDFDYFNDDSYFNKETYSIGFGPGFAFGKTVRFNLMIGYGFYDILGSPEMYPTGELGLYYRF
jgi:hypothetical protein